MRDAVKTIARLLLILGGVLLGLTLCEGVLRVAGLARKGSIGVIYRFDEIAGWGHRPGAHYRHATDEYQFDWDIGPGGFRDPRDFHAPDARVARILVLGDSHAAGHGVRSGATFAARLEQLLTERAVPCEVVNAAVDGYTTSQEVFWLREHGRSLAPDVVILAAYLGNDLFENLCPTGLGGFPRPLLTPEFCADPCGAPAPRASEPRRTALAELREYCSDHLRLYTFAGNSLKELIVMRGEARALAREHLKIGGGCLNQLLWQYDHMSDPDIARRALALTTRGLLAAEQLAQCQKSKLLVLFVPCRAQVDEITSDRDAIAPAAAQLARWQAEVAASLAGRVPMLDPQPALERARVEAHADLYYAVDWHLNEAGHDAVARALLARLGELRWLGSDR